MDERARFHTSRVGDTTHHRFDRAGFEGLDRGEAGTDLGDIRIDGRTSRVLRRRGLVPPERLVGAERSEFGELLDVLGQKGVISRA